MQTNFFKLAAAFLAAAAVASAAPASSNTDTADVATASPTGPQIGDVAAIVGETNEAHTDGEVDTQDFNVGVVYTNSNRGGSAGNINVNGIPSNCFNFVSPWIDSISSIAVDSGFRCQFFVDINCSGAVLTVQNGAFVADLAGTNFQDSLSSYKCFAS